MSHPTGLHPTGLGGGGGVGGPRGGMRTSSVPSSVPDRCGSVGASDPSVPADAVVAGDDGDVAGLLAPDPPADAIEAAEEPCEGDWLSTAGTSCDSSVALRLGPPAAAMAGVPVEAVWRDVSSVLMSVEDE